MSWLYLPVFIPLLCGSGVERLDKAHFMDALIKVIPSMAAYLSLREENDACCLRGPAFRVSLW